MRPERLYLEEAAFMQDELRPSVVLQWTGALPE
jgi:hypothetical protein